MLIWVLLILVPRTGAQRLCTEDSEKKKRKRVKTPRHITVALLACMALRSALAPIIYISKSKKSKFPSVYIKWLALH